MGLGSLKLLLGTPKTPSSWLAHCTVTPALTLRAASMTQVEVNEDSLEQPALAIKAESTKESSPGLPLPTQKAGAQGDEGGKR